MYYCTNSGKQVSATSCLHLQVPECLQSVDQWLGVQLEKWLLRYSLVNENSDSSSFLESSSYSFWFLRCAPKYWKAKLYSQTLAIALSWFNLLKISLGEDFAPAILMALEVCQNSNAMPEETLRHF